MWMNLTGLVKWEEHMRVSPHVSFDLSRMDSAYYCIVPEDDLASTLSIINCSKASCLCR